LKTAAPARIMAAMADTATPLVLPDLEQDTQSQPRDTL
jgi:hypothetical protein